MNRVYPALACSLLTLIRRRNVLYFHFERLNVSEEIRIIPFSFKALLLILAIIVEANFTYSQNPLYNEAALYEHYNQLSAISSGDVFNDGNCFIIVGDNSGHLLFLNWENAELSLVDSFLVPFNQIYQVEVEDIDLDGYNELIVCGADNWNIPGGLVIYQFNQEFEIEWDIFDIYIPSFVISNLDKDPNNELAICDGYQFTSENNLWIFSVQNSNIHLDYSTLVSGAWLNKPTAGDFDGDYSNELALSNDNGYVWIYGFSNGTYNQFNTFNLSQGGAAQATAGNLIDDSSDELLLGTNGGSVQILDHLTGWDFTNVWSQDIGRLAYNVEICNIDTDPECEFAVVHSNTDNYYDGQVSVFDNVSGNFEMVWHDVLGYSNEPMSRFHALLSDLNQDYSIELLVTINNSLILYTTEEVTGIDVNHVENPYRFILGQNYPNPFNPSTTIKYELLNPCEVTIEIYDILGRQAATLVREKQQAGHHSVVWNAGAFSSGIYLVRIQAGDYSETKKMVLLR